MAAELHARLIDAVARTVTEHAGLLTRLDQAIGDGDHGINLKRGFDAVREARDRIAGEPAGKALHSAGMVLVMTVGGASGPLYGSLLMAMGKAAPENELAPQSLARMVDAGVAAVMQRGKSGPGEKTMLQVLVPVAAALRDGIAAGLPPPALTAALRRAADAGLAASRDLRATKGRASFLGERSIGHLDPGAQSSCLIVHAVCDVVEGRA